MVSAAPTANDLRHNSIVVEAIAAAWHDSLPDDPQLRHEEGGWIYLEPATGEISIERAKRGGRRSINLSRPPEQEGFVVVGKFHTHPNPSDEGWESGPSEQDLIVDQRHGVPDLIRSDEGIFVSGPDSRRGGLAGLPGYPN